MASFKASSFETSTSRSDVADVRCPGVGYPEGCMKALFADTMYAPDRRTQQEIRIGKVTGEERNANAHVQID
jgi:hypothetical protein